MTSIWWIRRDLRLTDNPALHAALQAGAVIPAFILDPAFARSSARRRSFLYAGLRALDRDLRARGSKLVVRSGQPLRALGQLLAEANAAAIFAEQDFTPYARKRDGELGVSLPLKLIEGQTVHHPAQIRKENGTPYTVYTAYSRAWKKRLGPGRVLVPAPETIPTPAGVNGEPLPDHQIAPHFPAGEEEALVRLEEFVHRRIYAYGEDRNRPDLDSTSALSPYIRFGMLGMRQAVEAAHQARVRAGNEIARRNAEVWLNELVWREFYIQILYHFPHVARGAFNRSLVDIPWRNRGDEFEAWKGGRTGVPIVDAGMRQLLETGWMHNRTRMITASYLVKDLLIDWRWGEAWFMENLLDGDLAANNGGWQWTAGTGTDAAPYFRIFNPVLQSRRFDPDGAYIRRWVPELRGLDAREIHAPWENGIAVRGYPEKPIVDRDRERTLQAYQRARAA